MSLFLPQFGHGKDAISRDARATSPELKGKMSIVVSADGKARVSKFFIAKPSIVRVREGKGMKRGRTRRDRDGEQRRGNEGYDG